MSKPNQTDWTYLKHLPFLAKKERLFTTYTGLACVQKFSL